MSDEYNASLGLINTHTTNLLVGWGNIEGATSMYCTSVSNSANVTTVKTFTAYGAEDMAGFVIDVFAR